MRAPPEVEEVYRGVAAPARKAVTEEATVGDMPKARLEMQRVWCLCVHGSAVHCAEEATVCDGPKARLIVMCVLALCLWSVALYRSLASVCIGATEVELQLMMCARQG